MRRASLALSLLFVVAAALYGIVRTDALRAELGYYQPERTLDFETGDFRDWQLLRLPSPDSAVIVTSPVRHGRYAAAISLFPSARYGDAWKSELSDRYHAPFGKEVWYRASHFLPADFAPGEQNPCVLAQWHNVVPKGTGFGGKPPLALRYVHGQIRLTVSFSRAPLRRGEDIKTISIYEGPLPPGRWHDFVYRVVFSATDLGSVDVWRDGRRIARYRGPVGYPNDPLGPYFKTGVYCVKSPDRTLTAYVDEYRRGRNRADVLLPDETLEDAP